jgi:hypothetical protein
MAPLKVRHNFTVESTKLIEENVDPVLIEKMRTGHPLRITGIP